MNWTNAVVNVRSDRYVGVAVVQAFNDDDTVTVLNEMTGGEYRVEKDAIDLVLCLP